MEHKLELNVFKITKGEVAMLMQSINATKRRMIQIRKHIQVLIENRNYTRCGGLDFCREPVENYWLSTEYVVQTVQSKIRRGRYSTVFKLFFELQQSEERRQKNQVAIEVCNILNYAAKEGYNASRFTRLQDEFQYIYRTEMYNMIQSLSVIKMDKEVTIFLTL